MRYFAPFMAIALAPACGIPQARYRARVAEIAGLRQDLSRARQETAKQKRRADRLRADVARARADRKKSEDRFRTMFRRTLRLRAVARGRRRVIASLRRRLERWKKPPPKITAKLRRTRGCRKDTDCVFSCVQEKGCCPRACRCNNLYNRTYLRALQSRNARRCKRHRGCPKVSCPRRRYLPLRAECFHGLCQLVSINRRGVPFRL